MTQPVRRILVVHNRYRSALPSGENEVVDTEIALLREAGVDVLTHLRDSDDIAEFGAAARAALPVRPVYSRPDARIVGELIAARRPDVLHLHNPFPLISPAVVRVAQRAGVPVVQSVHNFRHVCLSGTQLRAGRPCTDCAPGRFALPGVRHGCYRGSRAQSAVLATSLRLHRPTFLGIDRFLALNDGVVEHLRRYGVPDHRIVVKVNTVADPGAPTDVRPDGFVFVGRLSAEKGIRLLLDAWSRFPPHALGALTVVGDGPDRALVDEAAAHRGDIVVLGRQPLRGVYDAMRAARALVVPSVCAEVFPRVVVEALALGRPVVATELGGLPTAVGDAGWLVAPRPDVLALRLDDVARQDLRAVSARARQRYETAFSPGALQRQLLDVYDDVTARSRC